MPKPPFPVLPSDRARALLRGALYSPSQEDDVHEKVWFPDLPCFARMHPIPFECAEPPVRYSYIQDEIFLEHAKCVGILIQIYKFLLSVFS